MTTRFTAFALAAGLTIKAVTKRFNVDKRTEREIRALYEVMENQVIVNYIRFI